MSSTNGNGVQKYGISNPFRTRILAGEVCPTMTAKLVTSNEIAMIAKMADIPGIFIEMEHSTMNFKEMAQLVLACNYVGVTPIVRVPSKSHWHLSRAFDAGAGCVVVPHIETVEEVKGLVQASKFAPIGVRGCSNAQPLFNFQNVPTLTQNEILNRETWLIPMIETPGAVEIVDEILAVDGVDGILIGSNDLTTDMGIPGQYDDPLYQEYVTKIVLAGKKAGKPIGIGGIANRTDLLEKWFAMGASWSLSGQDLGTLQAGMKKIGENYRAINERVQKAKSA
ncbi:hpcH/HpaI aldolase/citrate lyase family protein [Sarocladium implicatum]|nr:hpcH/HpaI aldolase/citrate lyase family protein [Sarocladium implicatum]